MAIPKTSSKTSSKGRTTTKSLKKTAGARLSSETKRRGGAAALVAEEVTIDRRRDERRDEECEESATGSNKLERRQKVNRRRQIDPTTCERDYNEQEIEFMNALDDYKRKSGRMFPTCSEVLEVIVSLGYVKLSANQMAAGQASSGCASAKPMQSDLQLTAVETALNEIEQLM